MKLVDTELIFFDVEAQTKQDVIEFIAKKMLETGRISDLEGYVQDVLAREETFSTAVGFSVATPHAKTDYALHATVAFARLKKPILWDEDEEAELIFQLAIPTKDKGDRHLQILASLSRRLIHEEFREQVINAATPEEIIQLIGDID